MEKELPKPRTLEDVHQDFMEEIRKSGWRVLEQEGDEQEMVISFPTQRRESPRIKCE